MSKVFGYYINVDDHGYFRADVRNEAGCCIFEICAGKSLPDGGTSIFEDSHMRDADDVRGLEAYLKSLSAIPSDGELLPEAAFEEVLAKRQEAGRDSMSMTP